MIVTPTTQAFWDAIAQGKLLLQYDPRCGRYQFFPRPLSLWTEGPLEWREASGRGTLVAATLTHFPAPGFKDKLPYLQGLVRLEEGPRIFANLTGATLPQLVPGKAMRLVFGAEPGGPFLFEPAA